MQPQKSHRDSFGKVPLVKTKIPGPRSLAILEKQRAMETRTVSYPVSFPVAIKRTLDSVVEDADGNLLIDWMTGICVLNLGYNDKIREAVGAQMQKTWHALEIPTEARIEFLEDLRKSFPAGMGDYKAMFGISGADACETAINMAHAYTGNAGPTIAFEGAYHGIYGGIISATAGAAYRRPVYSPGFNVVRVPYPYTVWYDNSMEAVLETIERVMNDPESGYARPDSLIVEPVQGEGGYVVPPAGFLRRLRELCDKYDLVMIVDEVQTGVGRTGKMWGFEWDSIKPDIVCVSKSIGGGIPLSVLYYRDEIDQKLPTPFHFGTYRANPLAMAAGSEVLREVPNHLARVRRDGERLRKMFSEMESPCIRDVRGKGFMVAVELAEGKKPMPKERVLEVKHDMLRQGLMMHTCGHFANVFRFMGALNIPDEYLDTGLSIFRKALRSAERR